MHTEIVNTVTKVWKTSTHNIGPRVSWGLPSFKFTQHLGRVWDVWSDLVSACDWWQQSFSEATGGWLYIYNAWKQETVWFSLRCLVNPQATQHILLFTIWICFRSFGYRLQSSRGVFYTADPSSHAQWRQQRDCECPVSSEIYALFQRDIR